MVYFVSAKDPYQGLYLFAVLPRYSGEKWSVHHQLCLSTLITSLLKNEITDPVWLKWGVLEEGTSPKPCLTFHQGCVAAGGTHRWVLGPSATWRLHVCGRNTVHGPFEVFFINIQFPLTQRATQHSSPSCSCMPIICRLKLAPMCISTMGPALSGMGLWNYCADNLGIKRL